MNGHAKKGIQWGAVVAAIAVLGSAVVWFDCAPTTSGQMKTHELREDGVHREFYHNQQHMDSDIGRVLRKLGEDHDDGLLVKPSPISE